MHLAVGGGAIPKHCASAAEDRRLIAVLASVEKNQEHRSQRPYSCETMPSAPSGSADPPTHLRRHDPQATGAGGPASAAQQAAVTSEDWSWDGKTRQLVATESAATTAAAAVAA